MLNFPFLTTSSSALNFFKSEWMSELHDSVDYNNLKFEYVGSTKDVTFYEYMDSKELSSAVKNNQIKFSEVKNKKNNFLKKLNEVNR